MIFQTLNYQVPRKNAEGTLLREVAFAALTVFYLLLLSVVIGSDSRYYPNDPSSVISILTTGSFILFFYYRHPGCWRTQTWSSDGESTVDIFTLPPTSSELYGLVFFFLENKSICGSE